MLDPRASKKRKTTPVGAYAVPMEGVSPEEPVALPQQSVSGDAIQPVSPSLPLHPALIPPYTFACHATNEVKHVIQEV